jgi:hypothetical protein
VFIVEYEAKRSESDILAGPDEHCVLSIFSTAERAKEYMRKFYNKQGEQYDYNSVDYIEFGEDNKGNYCGKVTRTYESNDYGLRYERLTMSTITLDKGFNPFDDITDIWC